MRDLGCDLGAWTCALQPTPLLSHCPLKIPQRAGHRFTLKFIEHFFSVDIFHFVFDLNFFLVLIFLILSF